MTMVRMPFHFGLFYNAIIGLLGREPDRKLCCGFDGFYDFMYIPRNKDEQEKFSRNARAIAEWLDLFEIQFSHSRCEYGSKNDPNYTTDNVLHIKISHPVKKEKD